MSRALLILRPEPGASATAARAKALGLDVVRAPLFVVAALPWMPPAPAGFDAVLMTSANAARLGGAGLVGYRHLPVVAVGGATGAAARAAGFVEIVEGEGDVAALRPILTRYARILHIAGREHRPADDAIAVVPVYAADPLPPPDLPERGVALLHSPRAAARFVEICPDKSRFDIVAISAAAAAAACPGWRTVAIAERPNDAAMLALAARLCEGP